MKLKIIGWSAIVILIVLLFAQEGTTNEAGAIAGVTGAPGESTCGQAPCHNATPNSETGSMQITIAGNPTSYTPNTTYDVTVAVGEFLRNKFGFEVTVLDGSDNKVGSLAVTNATETQKRTGFGREYITHTSSGTTGSTSKSWTFSWTAPSSNVGDVTFYAAGNAANDNGNSTGDHIYTTSLTISGSAGSPAPVAGFTISDNSICINESTTFTNTSTGSITGYSWNFGANASPATATTAGPHSVSYSAAGTKTVQLIVTGSGGSDTTTNTVTVNAFPTANATTADDTVCVGSGAQLMATGGTSYVWSPSGSLSNAGIANPVATPTVTTTYNVTVTDVNGCTATDNVKVTVIPVPNVTTSGDKSTCAGGGVTISAVGGVSYSWTPTTGLNNPNISNPIASPSVTTVYTVTVTGSNGCTASADVTVNVSPIPVTTSNDTTICRGTSTTISASGGVLYSWSPTTGLSDPAIASPTASPTVNTTYTVTVTAGNGCTGTGDVTVSVMGPTAVATGAAIICEGGSAQLGASGGVSYSWFPASSLSNPSIANPVASPSVTTTYTVTATDANGCTDTDNVTVTVDPAPNISTVGDTSFCPGGSVLLATSGGVGYSWSPGTGLDNPNISSPTASPTVTTTYTVTVTSGSGCTATASLTVTANAAPSITTSANTSICVGGSTQLNATGGTTYLWSPGVSLDDANIANPLASPSVTTAYSVTVTDANGCSGTGSTTVTVSNSLTVNVNNDTTICDGASVQLMASGGNTYAWSPSTGLSDTTIFNPVASPSSTTTYTVDATDGVCQGSAQVTVTVQGTINTTISADTSICPGESVMLTATGGTGYTWSPAAGLSATNVSSPTATPTSTTTYMVTITNGSCTNVEDVKVTIDRPNVTKSGNDTICEGQSTQLIVTGGGTYSWSPTTGLSDPSIGNPLASPSSSTTYSVTVTSATGCTATASIDITVNSAPLIQASSDEDICAGSAVSLSAAGGVSYSWAPTTGLDDPNIANPTASPTVTTTYTVTGTGANGCAATDDVTINVDGPLNVVVNPSSATLAYNNGTFTPVQLSASGGSGGASYSWSPATGLDDPNIANPVVEGEAGMELLDMIVYTVVVTDGECVDSATVTVDIDTAVAINELSEETFSVYPNPVSEQLFVKLHQANSERVVITLTDLTGKDVLRTSSSFSSAITRLDVTDIAPGMYLLIVQDQEQRSYRKIFVQ